MWLLIVGWSQGCLEFITNPLQVLSWDMRAHKASFVAKDRTLGQSTPSLTEMLFLSSLLPKAGLRGISERSRINSGPRVPIQVVLFTFCGPRKVSRNPKTGTGPLEPNSRRFPCPLWVFLPPRPPLPGTLEGTPTQAPLPCGLCPVLTSPAVPCPPHPLLPSSAVLVTGSRIWLQMWEPVE